MRTLRPLTAHLGTAAWLGLAALFATGCDGGGIAQSWQLDRLRVLAVRADPAEPRPGDQVSFEALYYLPDGQELALSLWFACLLESADSTGCEVDQDALSALAGTDLESLTPEEQAALIQQLIDAGLVGAEPLLSPSWTVPEDSLDGLEEDEKLEGLTAIVNITALPADAASEADTELAFKRIPVSEALTPNHNPTVTGFLVNGEAVALDAVVSVLWGQEIQLEPVLSDDSIETYSYRDQDGVDEERVEEPYSTWYTEEGSFDQPFSLYPYLNVAWIPPTPQGIAGFAPYRSEEVREVRVISVVRDRRGGMAWGGLTMQLQSIPLP